MSDQAEQEEAEMSGEQRASERITEVVTGWPGVSAGPGDRGSFSFRLGRREIGHLHGDRVAHFAFPKSVRAQLLASGRVVAHPVPSPGLAARPIEGEDDVREVIALMRLNYERMRERAGVSAGAA